MKKKVAVMMSIIMAVVIISCGKVKDTSNTVTTVAGSSGASGSMDSYGSSARFSFPFSITTDGKDLYVADTNNNTIRKIDGTTGMVTTFAGIAGAMGTNNGTGTQARFNHPEGIASDGTSLYVADTGNNTIRKIVISTQAVTTLAGVGGSQGKADGTGTLARFNYPTGITTDGTNLFVADMSNHTIRKIVISSDEVTTLAGVAGTAGSSDGTGTSAYFNCPYGVTTDGTTVYVADTNNNMIRQIAISTAQVTTLAGSASSIGSSDGTGTSALFNFPVGVFLDGSTIYIADTGNNTIRQLVVSTGAVTTLAGSAGTAGSSDDAGTSATFNYPTGITRLGGYLFITDAGNSTIRALEL